MLDFFEFIWKLRPKLLEMLRNVHMPSSPTTQTKQNKDEDDQGLSLGLSLSLSLSLSPKPLSPKP
jgi:hypothetical protein